MPTASDLVSVARSQVGITEWPAGSNRVKYWTWYDPEMQGEPWCDCFVSWCAHQVGADAIIGKYAYCPYHVNFFKKRGEWLDREEKPQPGDIVFFANASGVACHVGIVVSRNGSASVTTVEGNTSAGNNANGGAVQERIREYGAVGSSWYILGFGRPNWSGISAPVKTTPVVNELGAFDVAQLPLLKRGAGIGAPNNSVKALQAILRAHGFNCGEIDGEFGSLTENAVLEAQVHYFPNQPNEHDGEVGPKTWAKLLL